MTDDHLDDAEQAIHAADTTTDPPAATRLLHRAAADLASCPPPLTAEQLLRRDTLRRDLAAHLMRLGVNPQARLAAALRQWAAMHARLAEQASAAADRDSGYVDAVAALAADAEVEGVHDPMIDRLAALAITADEFQRAAADLTALGLDTPVSRWDTATAPTPQS